MPFNSKPISAAKKTFLAINTLNVKAALKYRIFAIHAAKIGSRSSSDFIIGYIPPYIINSRATYLSGRISRQSVEVTAQISHGYIPLISITEIIIISADTVTEHKSKTTAMFPIYIVIKHRAANSAESASFFVL